MKRYVMLEDKEIVDTWVQKYYINGVEGDVPENLIKKQADNLFDLLEIGDCIEVVDEDVTYIVGLTREVLFKAEVGHLHKLNEMSVIKAIWKRNGDVMRRYEI